MRGSSVAGPRVAAAARSEPGSTGLETVIEVDILDKKVEAVLGRTSRRKFLESHGHRARFVCKSKVRSQDNSLVHSGPPASELQMVTRLCRCSAGSGCRLHLHY